MRISNVLADLACLVLFAAMGQYSHYSTVTFGGVTEILWPFVLAYVVVLAVVTWRRLGDRLGQWPIGLAVGLGTAALGLILRVLLTDNTAQLPFVLVAFGTVCALFVAYRLLTAVTLSRVSR